MGCRTLPIRNNEQIMRDYANFLLTILPASSTILMSGVKTVGHTIYQITHDFICIHNGLQAMRNCYNCRITSKLMSERRLNCRVSFMIFPLG